MIVLLLKKQAEIFLTLSFIQIDMIFKQVTED